MTSNENIKKLRQFLNSNGYNILNNKDIKLPFEIYHIICGICTEYENKYSRSW